MIYNGKKVKPRIGDLLRWNDESSEWYGFITEVSHKDDNPLIKFQFGDGSTKRLSAYRCRKFKIIARAK